MSGLSRFLGWWAETWRATRKARGLYVVMTLGFAALAIAAGLAGDAGIAALAGVASVSTIVLVALGPQISRWVNPPPDGEEKRR